MAKIIIYTGSTGAGHTLAALSLQQALEISGNTVQVIDAFEESGDILNRTVTNGYKQLVENMPRVYKVFYKQFDGDSRTKEIILKRITKVMKDDLLDDIYLDEPDLIISTHPIVTNILGRLKDEGDFKTPILAFVTDYKIHDMYIRDSIDAYVVGSEYTKKTLEERGIEENKIYAYGIPVREEFRNINKSNHSDKKSLTILLMAGSLGSRQLKKAFMALLHSKSNLDVYVVCGKNERLKNVINQIITTVDHENKNIHVLGFTENISDLMDKSDLLITKPGGLTSTEAISKQVPIVIPYTYPGQEEQNAKFLVRKGMALIADPISDLSNIIDTLNHDRSILEEMKERMLENSANFSIDDTVTLCEELARK